MKLIRRNFLQGFTAAAGAALATKGAVPVQTVDWRVKGFTCVTCAVGLETLLNRTDGVKNVKARYPEGTVHIAFDPAKVSDKDLRKAIAEMGFSVEPAA